MNYRHRAAAGVLGLAILAAFILLVAGGHESQAVEPPKNRGRIDVLFSPNGGCCDRIVREIESAKKHIRVQAHFFTCKEIAEALVEAAERGVKCELIVDRSQTGQRWAKLPMLARGGVKIHVDKEHATANNKIILIDKSTIITGSYNFTRAAEEKNAENVLFIKNYDELFDAYLENFEKLKEATRPYRE